MFLHILGERPNDDLLKVELSALTERKVKKTKIEPNILKT